LQELVNIADPDWERRLPGRVGRPGAESRRDYGGAILD
jgi:hypothetical protein